MIVPPPSKARPRRPGRKRAAHGLLTDGRQIGPPLLPRLDQLDQDTARPGPGQRAAAREHRIRALHRLDGEHDAGLHDAALTDIGRAERPADGDAARDIGLRLLVRRGFREQSGPADQPAQDLMGAEDAKTFLAQDADHRLEQAVIAHEGGTADARQKPQPLRIGPQVAEGGAPDRTDQDEIAGSPCSLSSAMHPHGRAHAQEGMGKGRETLGSAWPSRPMMKTCRPCRLSGPRHLGRKRAASGDDPKGRSWRSDQAASSVSTARVSRRMRPRLLGASMKARISATIGSRAVAPARFGQAGGKNPLLPEQQAEGAHAAARIAAGSRPAAAQADDIEAGEPRAVAHDQAEGDDIGLDPGDAADHGAAADADELVERRAAADHGAIARS